MVLAEAKNEFTLQLKRTFNAPREQVFAAWTEADALSRWFAPTDEFTTRVVELDVRVGGRYQFDMLTPEGEVHSVAGEYVAIAPPTQLVFTWAWINKEDTSEMLVTVDFLDKGDATELVLNHERLPDETSRDLHGEGWDGCLARLTKFLAAGQSSGQ